MFNLLPYQQLAVNAVWRFFEHTVNKNPLVILPTGTGKSVVIADLCRSMIGHYPSTRIIVATHVKELVAQNFSKFVAMLPDASAGIYSAGLGKKQVHRAVTFAGIQSVYSKAYDFQHIDILMVDEAHMIPRDAKTMWQRFITDLKTINPDLKIIGFTATAYRLDSGMLHAGDEALFDDICFEYPILSAIKDGYVCEIIPKSMATKLNVDGVKKTKGDFVESQLQKAVNVDAVTKAAVQEILEYGQNRRAWLVFGSGVEHATAIMDEMRANGIDAAIVTGETPDGERDAILRDFKAGKLRCVVNNSVLTTGFDAPNIDLIAAMRPTQSPVLWIQMLGRGMRPVANVYALHDKRERLDAIAASMKPNCLLLDFAGNTKRHGPLDKIRFKDHEKGEGSAPIKECPQCLTIVFAGVRICPDCGFPFPEPELKIEDTSGSAPVLSTQTIIEEYQVTSVAYWLHEKAKHKDEENKKPPTLRVDYYCGYQHKYSEWVCIQHVGFARQKAEKWWRARCTAPMPATVEEAVYVARKFPNPTAIRVRKGGKFDEVVAVIFPDTAEQYDPQNEQQPATDQSGQYQPDAPAQEEWYDIPLA